MHLSVLSILDKNDTSVHLQLFPQKYLYPRTQSALFSSQLVAQFLSVREDGSSDESRISVGPGGRGMQSALLSKVSLPRALTSDNPALLAPSLSHRGAQPSALTASPPCGDIAQKYISVKRKLVVRRDNDEQSESKKTKQNKTKLLPN